MVDRERSKDKRIENVRDPRKIVPYEIEMKVSHAVETNCTFVSAFLFRRFLSKFHTQTVAFIFCFSYTAGYCYRQKRKNTRTTVTSITRKVLRNGYDSLAFHRTRARYLYYVCIIALCVRD